MQKDLLSIFKSITPDNIQNVDFISDAMEIFVQVLEEQCKESIDIRNMYDNQNFREELIRVYQNDLYNIITTLKYNSVIANKMASVNSQYEGGDFYYNTAVINNLTQYITDEHFLTLREFNEKKGTIQAIEYMFRLISEFISPGQQHQFTLEEIEPFNYSVEGSMAKEFYDYIVRPLAHPLGFIYSYIEVLALALEDYYVEANIKYTVYSLEVRTLYPDGSTSTEDYSSKVVVDVDNIKTSSETTRTITFDDGTYLKQVTELSGQITVWYMAANDTVIKKYDDQSSIYFDYDFEYLMELEESLSFSSDDEAGDYYGRLDYRKDTIYIGEDYSHIPYIDDAIIGEFHIGTPEKWIQKGFNLERDRDGNNLIPSGNVGETYGRIEHYFTPSNSADLKMLNGEYQIDVDIYNGPDFLETQRIYYTNVIDPALKVVDWILPEQLYFDQNVGNEQYWAHEHLISNLEFGENIAATYTYDYFDGTDYTIQTTAEIYRDSWHSTFDDNSLDDLSDFGVYRNDILVEDNNYNAFNFPLTFGGTALSFSGDAVTFDNV